MSEHSLYESLRHLADSYGLAVMMVMFLCFIAWPFRPGARRANDRAANQIFEDSEDGE